MHTETAKKIYTSEATAKGIATKLNKTGHGNHVVRKVTTGWAVVDETSNEPAKLEYALVPANGGPKQAPAPIPTTKVSATPKPMKPKTQALGTIEADLYQITNAYVGIKCGGGKLLWIGKSNIIATTNVENGKVQLTLPMAFIKKRGIESLLIHTSENVA